MRESIKGLRVLVTTCNAYRWALPAFAHQFNKYWSPKQEVVVGCFAPPKEKLPSNFTIHQIQKKDIPRAQRSTGMVKFFNQMPDEHFVFMLEDFWLCDYVDIEGIRLVFDLMKNQPDILRVDLTIDRVKSCFKNVVGKLGHLTLIESRPGDRYRWSHQGALWNKQHTLRYLLPGEGAAGEPIEIMCTRRLNSDPQGPRVLGTLNWPLKYAHVLAKGRPERNWLLLNTRTALPAADIQELRDLGHIDCEKKMAQVRRFNE